MNTTLNKGPDRNNIRNQKWGDTEYRNLALAVSLQCAQLVDRLASHGEADSRQINACVEALLLTDPEDVSEIYPQPSRFYPGLALLQEFMGGETRQHATIMGYFLGLLVLTRKLQKNSRKQQVIRDRIQELVGLREKPAPGENRGEHDTDGVAAASGEAESLSDEDYARLSALYQDTVSKLSFRIQVQGRIEHLQNAQVADRVRALLLAGIRATILWQQLGGRRWHLLFYRKRIRDSVTQIRRQLMAPQSL